jgi:thioredoxin reductase
MLRLMLPIAIIGAGPVGLAAAAAAHTRGLPFVVLEAGDQAGAAVAEWGHVRLFSPWRYLVDAAASSLLQAPRALDPGWSEPDLEMLPTGAQLVEHYLLPLAATSQLAPHIRYRAPVAAISRFEMDRVRSAGRPAAPFVVRLADGSEVLAGAVIDASGSWRNPNPVGGNGLPARGEGVGLVEVEPAMPDVLGADRARFAGVHTVVVGAGHSAAGTLAALAELATTTVGTSVTWVVRRRDAERAYGGGDADALPARGALGTQLQLLVDSAAVTLMSGFCVQSLARSGAGRIEVTSTAGGRVVVDRVIAATGFRPDHRLAAELRLDLDPILGSTRTLAPLIDPNEHSCGTVRPHGVDELTHPEPNYFVVGMKSYGRAPTFLMATGYEQVRSIVAALDGDWAAAREVHLDLPETGVCSVDLPVDQALAEVAARLDLAPGVPQALVSATRRHLATAGSTAAAVRSAAYELDLDETVALQLAALAGSAFDGSDSRATPPTAVTTPPLVTVASTGSCCG